MTTDAHPTNSRSRHVDRVRRYYERNAGRFDRYSQASSIHRAVWGPGVASRDAAFHYVDDLILAAVHSVDGIPRVLDLGCGNGASLVYLAGRAALLGEGITISPAQARRAAELIAARGLSGCVRCREGNFLALPKDVAGADVAFSIEAFVHSPDASGYFREVARVVRRGGALVICDDFLTGRTNLSRTDAMWLDEFRRGWRVGSLLTVDQARELAGPCGLRLVDNRDLTCYLELRRVRDRWISALVAAARPLRLRNEWWHALLGGNALQRALQSGLLQYRLLRFERA
jgi:tocopherol O-methyltransferase